MAKITLINADSATQSLSADMIFTDPPFDMSGAELASIVSRFDVKHLVLITTMRQLLEFHKCSEWHLAFDFVVDAVTPKQSKSLHQPNYIHATGVYMTAKGTKTVFDRKRRQRSDVFELNGYYPTIFRAPRSTQLHGHQKNTEFIHDILGSFDIKSVIDPFAGSGSVGLAAFELGLDCTLIEKDPVHFGTIKKVLRFVGADIV